MEGVRSWKLLSHNEYLPWFEGRIESTAFLVWLLDWHFPTEAEPWEGAAALHEPKASMHERNSRRRRRQTRGRQRRSMQEQGSAHINAVKKLWQRRSHVPKDCSTNHGSKIDCLYHKCFCCLLLMSSLHTYEIWFYSPLRWLLRSLWLPLFHRCPAWRRHNSWKTDDISRIGASALRYTF